MKCKYCWGLIILERGICGAPDRLKCIACGREPKQESVENNSGDPMANRLKAEKEEEVKTLLKTHSVREIVKKTGVAFNTITRIRNENFTKEERAEMKERANIKGRHKRELEKRKPMVVEQVILPDKIDSEKEGIMEEKMKTCTKCNKELPATNEYFSKNKATKDGLEHWCKNCRRKKQADYRAEKAKMESMSSVRKLPRKGPVARGLLGIPIVEGKAKADPITTASPEEIIKALRKGVAREIIQTIQERFT